MKIYIILKKNIRRVLKFYYKVNKELMVIRDLGLGGKD